MSYFKHAQEDVEALPREWILQDKAQTRDCQVIIDQLNHDKTKQQKPPSKKKPEPRTKLEEDKRLKEAPEPLIDEPVQRDVDTMNGSTTVVNFRMEDDYGSVKVSLWNQQSEEIMNYVRGRKQR